MNKTAITLAAVAALALAGPAAAEARTEVYKGKTSSGLPITAKIDRGVVRYFVAGISTQCLPIQSRSTNGFPKTGVDTFGFESTKVKVKKRHHRFSFLRKPAFHFREVTMNHDLWIKRSGKRISGRMRLQYGYLVSTYPVGSFNVYSCLGSGKFKAKRVR